MPESIEKMEFIDQIRTSHEELESLLSQKSLIQNKESAKTGEWNIRDVIAHIAWYETEMVKVLQNRALVGSQWWNLPLEERNKLIHQAYELADLETVLDNEKATYSRMMELLELVPEEALNDPRLFKDMPVEWQPWEVIASNTSEHYPEHIQQIRDYLK